MRDGGAHYGVVKCTTTMNDDISHHLSFGCPITDSDVAPGFCISGGGVSLLTWDHCHLCLFMDTDCCS
jgi:hypothetical protein